MIHMADFEAVPVPKHPAAELLAHDAEAREIVAPLVDTLLDRLTAAGWDRRAAASALMFNAATEVSALTRRNRTA